MDNRPLSEQYRILAKQWVDAESAAHLLEETKTAVFAQKQVALGDMPVSRSEMLVKSSPEWHEHLTRIASARRAANLLKVQLKYLEMKNWEQRSYEATQRSEMRL